MHITDFDSEWSDSAFENLNNYNYPGTDTAPN